jgi:hypothetical protein
VPPVAEPVDGLAQRDHAREDQADDQHRADHVQAFLRGGLRGEHAAILVDAARVLGECGPRAHIRAPSRAGFIALAERRGRCGPGLAVAGKAVGAQLGAAGDQRGEVGHGFDGPGLGYADEAMRVEIVAEQERRVVVGGREEPRRPVVQEVALVDRLQAQRVALVGERREDRLLLALPGRAQGVFPEGTLACRLSRDRLPEIGRYNQVASSFVQ